VLNLLKYKQSKNYYEFDIYIEFLVPIRLISAPGPWTNINIGVVQLSYWT